MTEKIPLIFDMDGVLIHSNPLHEQAWLIYNRRFGIETGEAMQRRMWGRRNDDIVRDFFGADLTEEEVRAHGAAKEKLYREMAAATIEESLVPGVKEFLERHRGWPTAVASNAEPANVDFLLDAACLREYFQVIVAGHQVHRPKPHPEIYLRTAELLQARPQDCVVFEDSVTGVEAARAAGTRVVGVKTTHPDLPGVDLAIADFRDPNLDQWIRDHYSSVSSNSSSKPRTADWNK